MKFFILMILASLSFASLASVNSLNYVLSSEQMIEFDRAQTEAGYTLFNVKNLFAESGVRPRCACESLELSYVKTVNGNKTVNLFEVRTKGYGPALTLEVENRGSIVTRREVRD